MNRTETIVATVREMGRATKAQVQARLPGMTGVQVANALRHAVETGRLVTTGKPTPGTAIVEATYMVKTERPARRYASVWDYAATFAPSFSVADLVIPTMGGTS